VVLKSIGELVAKEYTDREIAEKLCLPLSKVYNLRTTVLKITFYGKKRKCIKCKQEKSVFCFSGRNPGYEDWCIHCRREKGLDVGRKKPTGVKKEKEKTELFICLKCNKSFESPIWGTNNKEHFYTCQHCRDFITKMERVGI